MKKGIKEIIYDRLYKNGVITTILGVIFLSAALVMYFNNDYPVLDVTPVAAIGLLLLGIKDDILSKLR